MNIFLFHYFGDENGVVTNFLDHPSYGNPDVMTTSDWLRCDKENIPSLWGSTTSPLTAISSFAVIGYSEFYRYRL